ncbi:MAG TPA: DUF4082 domain-containing protein [Candidatus Saccharimonadales bacterium]|nr:DUF4082 domain-containing protein [Candidatus Saccharimonadales bacterium]
MAVYTLFNQTGSGALQSDATGYTLTMQFSLGTPGSLTGIWWYSAAGTTLLPTACGVYQDSNQTLVASTTSPTWSGAAGSGWVKCSFNGSVTLQPGVKYRVAVFSPGGSNWYSAVANYFTTGGGTNGVQNGPITAPSNANSDLAQDAFVATAAHLTYPTGGFNGANYWIDVEVNTINNIWVVQSGWFPSTWSGDSPSQAITAGNTVFLIPSGYTNSNNAISTSSPTVGGTVVPNAVKLLESTQPSGSIRDYGAIWMLPNYSSGLGAFGITINNTNSINNVGLFYIEVHGLGPKPVLDQSVSAENMATTNLVNSGMTGAIRTPNEFILGYGIEDQTASNPPAGWACPPSCGGLGNSWAGYQVSTTSGGTYNWSQTASSNSTWTAGIVAVSATALPTVVQSVWL